MYPDPGDIDAGYSASHKSKSKSKRQAFGITGKTPLHFAAEGGSWDIAEFLYKQKPDMLEMLDVKGLTPFSAAAQGWAV